MNYPPSRPSVASDLTNTQTTDDIITINEKVNLTKQQFQVLKIICGTYETSFSEYMQQAIVEAMRFDIEEGNFSDTLLEKIGSEDSKNDNPSSPHSSVAQSLANNNLLVQSIASMMACMIFKDKVDITPYYAVPEKYTTIQRQQETVGVKKIVKLPETTKFYWWNNCVRI